MAKSIENLVKTLNAWGKLKQIMDEECHTCWEGVTDCETCGIHKEAQTLEAIMKVYGVESWRLR